MHGKFKIVIINPFIHAKYLVYPSASPFLRITTMPPPPLAQWWSRCSRFAWLCLWHYRLCMPLAQALGRQNACHRGDLLAHTDGTLTNHSPVARSKYTAVSVVRGCGVLTPENEGTSPCIDGTDKVRSLTGLSSILFLAQERNRWRTHVRRTWRPVAMAEL